MNHVLKGGAFVVLATDNSTATDHPPGIWVPPKGYLYAGAPANGMPPAMSGSNQTAATPTAAKGGGGSATGIPGM
jgi:hypothetical protein